MNFDAWRHYWRGQFLSQIKRPEQALAAYHDALDANPNFAQAAHCLGYLHAQRKEYPAAEKYFQLALQLRPHARAWYNLGFMRDQQGQKELAIEAFKHAVELDPKLDLAWYGLGMAYAALGQHEAAVNALEQAAFLVPRNTHVWYALGMAHHHAHSPDKVAAAARHLSRINPHMTRHLIQETERNDLRHLIAELKT